MPQVSNLSWIWSITIFMFLFLSMNLLFSFSNISSIKKNFLLSENKITFFFMV